MNRQKGFTLIELLLVLAIIGIIAAIAIPALLGQREKAKIKAVQALVTNIASECVRVNDDLRAAGGTPPLASAVVTAILKLDNFKYPSVKNPYGGTASPYVALAAPTKDGEVSLDAQETYTDPAVPANQGKAILITGQYTENGTTKTATKVVALD